MALLWIGRQSGGTVSHLAVGRHDLELKVDEADTSGELALVCNYRWMGPILGGKAVVWVTPSNEKADLRQLFTCSSHMQEIKW